MRLPISTASMTFMSVSAPQPVTDFETKQPRSDENGVPLYNAQVVALSDGEAEIMAIKVAGDPGRFGQGTALKVTGLTAQPWTMGDRSGISYHAERIEAQAASSRSS